MDNSIKLIIHRGGTIFDSLIITSNSVVRYEQKVRETKCTQVNTENENIVAHTHKICLRKCGYDAYLLSAFVITLMKSETYRKSAIAKLLQCLLHYKMAITLNLYIALMKLRTPKKQFLDYKWNERITLMVMEKREVDHAMSWLSTLGGAFSALGEEFHYCAEMAGKISIKQFQLALRLGDPLLVARCKLYVALSLIQRDQLKIPKQLIKDIYKFSVTQNDIRLQNMCQGIWAKLKYCYKIRKHRHKALYN